VHAERLELERQALVEASSPNFVAEYRPTSGNPVMPAAEETPIMLPRPLRTHDGRNRLRDPQRSEEVGLDDLARLGLRGLLDRAVQPVAGVVDEHIDAAEMLVHARDRGEDGCAIVDVELDASAFGDAARVGQPPAITRGQRDGVPTLERRARERAAEPAGRSRDQPHPHRAR